MAGLGKELRTYGDALLKGLTGELGRTTVQKNHDVERLTIRVLNKTEGA